MVSITRENAEKLITGFKNHEYATVELKGIKNGRISYSYLDVKNDFIIMQAGTDVHIRNILDVEIDDNTLWIYSKSGDWTTNVNIRG